MELEHNGVYDNLINSSFTEIFRHQRNVYCWSDFEVMGFFGSQGCRVTGLRGNEIFEIKMLVYQ